MTEHPSPLALERLAAGEDVPAARAHVEGCAACRAHVGLLVAAIGRTPADTTFLAAVHATATATATADATPTATADATTTTTATANATTTATAATTATTTTATAAVRAFPRRAAVVAGVLALAAAWLLFVRSAPDTTSLKGPLVVAVIVDRGGVQERATGACKVRPGDRLRLEFATASAGSFTAGVLTREGQWLELEPPGPFDAGTHLSRSSLRVDAEGLAGLAIVGEPAAVELARRGRPSSAVGVALERDVAK